MTGCEVSLDIQAPPEIVWRALSCVGEWLHWTIRAGKQPDSDAPAPPDRSRPRLGHTARGSGR